MRPEDFAREFRMCGSETGAQELFKEARTILSDGEYASLVEEIASSFIYRSFVRKIAQDLKEKRR